MFSLHCRKWVAVTDVCKSLLNAMEKHMANIFIVVISCIFVNIGRNNNSCVHCGKCAAVV